MKPPPSSGSLVGQDVGALPLLLGAMVTAPLNTAMMVACGAGLRRAVGAGVRDRPDGAHVAPPPAQRRLTTSWHAFVRVACSATALDVPRYA